MAQQSHRSDPRVLNRRTLDRDHRRLAQLLRPGMSILDIGCGTGAITAGIAQRVGPTGNVVGLDRDETLLAIAREEHAGIGNLSFTAGDILAAAFEQRFDIVTAARVIQWISDPAHAIRQMIAAAKPKGLIVILDYNHQDNSWTPEPPPSFKRFYHAFLDWRTANQWDNQMATHLPEILHKAGLSKIQTYPDDEISTRDDPAFSESAALWSHVIATIGPAIVSSGFLPEDSRREAGVDLLTYVAGTLQRQSHSMRTVIGEVG